MKKTGRNIGSGIVFILIALFVITKFFVAEQSPFGKDNSSFAADKNKQITSIELESGDNKVLLRMTDVGWSVNGTQEVSKTRISSFLSLLTEIQIKSPVAAQVFDDEVTNKGIVAVKVHISVRRGKDRSFLVYPVESNVYGNIMKTREKSKPFIVFAPGFDTNISTYFSTDTKSWLPFTVFALRPSEIKSVEVRYNGDMESSFVIDKSKGRGVLNGDDMNQDTLKIERYISYFNYIPFESWASTLTGTEKTGIVTSSPAIEIIVTTSDGNKNILSVWNRSNTIDGKQVTDTDRVWGRLNNSEDIFIMRYFDLDPILKRRSYFLIKN